MSDWFDCTCSPYDYADLDDGDLLYSQPDSDWDPLTHNLSCDAVSNDLLLELMPF